MLKRSVSRLDHTSFGLPCDLTVAANLSVGRGGKRKGGGGSCGLLSHSVQQQQQQQHSSVLKERSWVCSKLCLGIARRDFRTMLSENSSNPASIEEENNNKSDAASQVGIIKEVELDVTSSSILQEMQQQQQQQLLINSHESQEHMKRTAAELTEDLTRAEMLEHLQFIKRLPHKLLRDIGFIIAGPSLLSSSVELPVVSADLVGGNHSQWASTKGWLKSLQVSDVEAWFSSHRPSTRLGDHFALCVEYVLRFSPLINVHQLLTSQQVLQTVTKTSQDQGLLLSEREELLQVSSSSDGGFVVPAADTRSSCPIVPVLEATLSSSAAASERVNSRIEPTDNPTELVGKRKRKLLRKLERLRLGKGITTTIGEFDFLFQARPATAVPAAQDSTAALTNNHNSAAHDLVVQHWEVSVKYLLYAGPWEVFGMTTPDHAAWSCKDAKESDKEHGCSILSKTGNSNNANKEDADAAATKFVTTLQGGALDYVKDTDEFLGCFLGPHVGETLLDRKSRLCNQLALSSNPCAAVMLWNLYGKEAGAEMRSSDSNIEAETVEEYGADDSSITLTTEAADLQEQVVEMEQVVKVIPRALLKGYLFYEYKLWHYLNSQQYYHATSHNSAEHNGCSNNNNNNSTQMAKEQSETESTVQELHSSGENNNNDVTAIRDDKNQKQTSISDGEKLPAKSSLNMKHWMGWWTQDLTEFAYLPHHCGSMWYIVPKLEWLSPVIIPSSDKERCAQILSVEAFLIVAAGVQAEAGRLCMPKKSRFLVAELHWETSWKHEQELKVEEETQAANVMCSTTQQKSSGGIQGAWIETSRGFIVENTWPISKLYKPHGYVVSWSPSLQQLGQLNSSDP